MFGPLRGKTLRSRRQYYRLLSLLWVIVVIWVIASMALAKYWNDIPWPAKILAVGILILGTPALSDMFRPYGRYRKKWELENGSTTTLRQGDQ